MRMFYFSKVTIILVSFLYLVALGTVLMSAYSIEYSNLLKAMTQENSFFETLSVLFLLMISFYGISSVIQKRDTFGLYLLLLIGGFSLLTFIAAMEEISWGQHLLHFQSSDYFLEQNLQKETNLHNLIDANLFSSIVYTTVYIMLVFLPLLYKIFEKHLSSIKIFSYLDISPHTVLIVLFGTTFQIYFYNDIGVMADMFTLIAALLLFAYYLFAYSKDFWLRVHYLVIIIAVAISMASHQAYSFFNMQYEIREMFVVLAVLMIFIELIQKEHVMTNNRDIRR